MTKKPAAAVSTERVQLGTDAVITNAVTKQEKPAITSDRWHVVHSQWSAKPGGHPPFARRIASEHADKAAADIAAKKLAAKLKPTMNSREVKDRDQVLVRPPRFRSLKYKARAARNAIG